MLSFVSPLFYILLFNATTVSLTRRSFGKCLPITMMTSAFLLFFSQLLFGTFQVGFVIGIIITILSVILIIIRVRKKRFGEFKKLYFTSGFFVFLTVYGLVFVYDLARGFSAWDEFSHWGVMVKEMLRLDKFYSVEASNLMVHKDYPPIMQLFEVFWVKLCGGYKEAYLERALHTFEFSLFIPFVAEKVAKKRNALKSILVGVALTLSMAFVVVLFDQHGVFQTIYTDYVMGLVVVYLLVTILMSKKIDWFEILTIVVGGGFLLLLKQMGLPLYLMILCILAIVLFLRKKVKLKEWLKKVGVRKVVAVVLALLLPFVVWFIWGRMTTEVPKQFDLASMDVGGFAKMILGGGGEEWQRFTIKKFADAVSQTSISNSFVPISYLQGVILFVLLIWAVYRCFMKGLDKKEIIALGVVVVIGAIGYAVTMMMLYVLAFGSYEGPILASYERYMGTYMIILFGLVLAIVVWQTTKNKDLRGLFLVTLMLALVVAPSAYERMYPSIKVSEDNYTKYSQLADEMKEKIEDESAKVFIIAQESVGFHYYLQYYATPMKINSLHYSWLVGDDVDGAEEYGKYIEPYLSGFDYLYVVDVNEDFKEEYCKVVDFCPLSSGELYRIEEVSGKAKLEKI